jgi:UTP--glucose-1-phosphate uridylyltransferase
MFEGNSYDIGGEFGFIKVTIDYAMEWAELKEQLLSYLKGVMDKGNGWET